MNKFFLTGLLLLGLLCFSACPKSDDGGGAPAPASTPDGSGEEASSEGGE